MLTVFSIAEFLKQFAPTRLAEEWDNVGLLVGSGEQAVRRIMTCLTITPESAAEAVAEKADLIVAHHPLPFRPLKRLTAETVEGRLLLDLVGARIAVYSPHTAFDSAGRGINQRLAEGLQLDDIMPLTESADDPTVGTGRFGELAQAITLGELTARVGRFLSIDGLQLVGDPQRQVQTVAVGCGSAGDLIATARERGCDVFVTGESRFHGCLEAEGLGVALILAGHYATERFAVVQLADVLAAQFPAAAVWASRRERDPLRWVETS